MFRFSTLVAVLVIILSSSAAFAQKGDDGYVTPVQMMPIFESHGNVSGDSGSGWWNLQQYEDRASINAGSSSRNQIIGTSSGLWVDYYNPSRFNFQTQITFLDDSVPSGKLNFSQSSSNDMAYSYFTVSDQLQDIWGENKDGKWGVIGTEWWSNLYFNLNTPSMINGLSGRFELWKEGLRHGDYFVVSGYGTFLGSDPVGTGKGLVKSGFASYSVQVPEPASLGLIAFSAIGLLIRRR